MKNAYRLFVGLLVVTMSALAYADVVSVPAEGAGSIDAATIVAPMSADTTVWVQNTFGNEIELYSGTTPSVPSGSQGLIIGGTENAAKIKVITNCLQNLGQTTVMNNGALTVSGADNTDDYLYKNLTISGGSVLVKKNYYSLRNGGNITLSDGSLEFLGRFRVGYDSAATFDQTGGTVKLNTISDGDNKFLSIGYKEGADGVYNMSGNSTLNTPLDIYIGDKANAKGTLKMEGGKVNSNASLRVGSNGEGTFNLFGGEFIQSAGWANLAYEAGSKGTMTVKDGGTFTYSSNDLRVGRAGEGILNLEPGGTINLGGKALVLGYYEGSSGEFNMTGGTLTASSITLGETKSKDDKEAAKGTATISNNATLSVPNSIYVGKSGVGTLNVDSATVNVGGNLHIGQQDTKVEGKESHGEVYLTDKANLSVTGTINVGTYGSGIFSMNDSSAYVGGKMYIGGNAEDTFGTGTVTLTNSSYTTDDTKDSCNVYAGYNGSGSLTLDHSSATIYGYLYVGRKAVLSEEGEVTGAKGDVTLKNGSSLSVYKHSIRVGEAGIGSLNILSGSTFFGSEIYLGQDATANGTLKIDNGEILQSKRIVVGNYGKGTMNANNASINVISGGIYIGGNEDTDNKPAGDGIAALTNTTAVIYGDLSVGNYGKGDLTLDGSTVTIYEDDSTADKDGYLFVGKHTGSTGTLTMQNGTYLSTPNHTPRIGQSGTGTVKVESGSTLDTAGNDLYLGYNASGDGTLNIDGGSVASKKIFVGNSGNGKLEVKNGSIDTSSNNIYLGNSEGHEGTLKLMDGGVINTGTSHIYVSNAAGATGTFNMTGGILTAGDLRVGDTGTGVANISGGTIDLTYVMYAGIFNGGDGTLNISGASTNITAAGNITVAYDAGSTGVMNIKGGTVTGKSELYVARSGNGSMTVDGGNLTVSGLSNVGYSSGTTGELTIKNGSVTLTNSGDSFRIGREGAGTVEVLDDGYLVVKNYRTDLGFYGSGQGTLTIDGGTAILKELRVGYVKDPTKGRSINNHFNMLDGLLNITETEINVGYNAYGYATVSGGEINFTSLRVGRDDGSYGELTIEGTGVMNMSSAARISANAGSEGHVYIKDNGQMNVTKELTIGQNSYGTVEVSGGQLNAYPVNINNGELKVSGGVVRSNQVLVNNGTSMTVSGGQVNVGLITLDGSSDMTLSGAGVINVGDITVNNDAIAYLYGGTLSVGSLNNVGTTYLDGSTIDLGTNGIINSTGYFSASSGSVVVNPDNYAYTAGDQIIIGRFWDYNTAETIKGMTTVPEGWSTAALYDNYSGYSTVIAQKGSEPTGMKVWIPGTQGALYDESCWSGDTSNNTGFVLGGTNKFTQFTEGNLVLVDGDNTFSINAPVPAGSLLINDGGTTTYGSADIEMNGTLIVNGGTFKPTKDKHIYISGTEYSPAYGEVNGGTFDASRRLIIGNNASSDASSDKPTTSAKFVINGGIVKTCSDGSGDLYICRGASDTPGIVAELELNGGELQVLSTKTTYIGYDSQSKAKFTMTNGKFTTEGVVRLAYGSQSTGTLAMSGGSFTTGGKLYLANGERSTGTFDFSGGFLTTASVDVGKGENSTGTLNVSGGAFTSSDTITIAAVNTATGVVNVSGGKLKAKNIKVGFANAGEAAQLNITGGIVEITSAMYGSDSTPSGNVSISGTGQLLLNSTYSDATFAGIRELSSLEIAGKGDGNGAMRFLESLDSSVPITLTNDATIGIRAGATFTQRAEINAVPKRSAEQPVLTVAGGGTLDLTPSELGTLDNLKVSGASTKVKLSNTENTTNLHISSIELDGGTLELAAGTTVNPGFGNDSEPFTVSINEAGKVVFNGTLLLDAYKNDFMNGMDKLDFTNFNLASSEVVFGNDFQLAVNLIDVNDFLGQIVNLAWAPGLPGDLINDADIALSLYNTDGQIVVWGFNPDGSIFFADASAIPEPSTWALLILGAAGLLYWRKRKNA